MTQPAHLYNLHITAHNCYEMAKLDTDLNVEAVYHLVVKGHSYTCDCPANNRSVVTKPCKHKRMMPLMLGAVNTDRFYDPETGKWHMPFVAEEPPAKPELPSEARGIEGKAEEQIAPGFIEAVARVNPNAIGEGIKALASPATIRRR